MVETGNASIPISRAQRGLDGVGSLTIPRMVNSLGAGRLWLLLMVGQSGLISEKRYSPHVIDFGAIGGKAHAVEMGKPHSPAISSQCSLQMSKRRFKGITLFYVWELLTTWGSLIQSRGTPTDKDRKAELRA